MAERWEEDNKLKNNWEDDDESSKVKDAWDDEEEEVKDSWDQDDTPKVPKAKPIVKPANKAPQKDLKDMTEEEKREAQESADIKNAMELLGLNKSLEELRLENKEDIKSTVDVLYARLNLWNKKEIYPEFLEALFKSLCEPLPSDSIRRVWNTLKNLGDQKLAEEKANKPKEIKKPKVKAPKIKMEQNPIKGDFDFYKDAGGGYEDEDGEDFM